MASLLIIDARVSFGDLFLFAINAF